MRSKKQCALAGFREERVNGKIQRHCQKTYNGTISTALYQLAPERKKMVFRQSLALTKKCFFGTSWEYSVVGWRSSVGTSTFPVIFGGFHLGSEIDDGQHSITSLVAGSCLKLFSLLLRTSHFTYGFFQITVDYFKLFQDVFPQQSLTINK